MTKSIRSPAPEPDEPQERPARRGPLTLRLGELQGEVASRTKASSGSEGATVKRDLERYYRLLREQRTWIWTLPEAEALVFGLWGFDAANARYIWAEIDRQFQENEESEREDPTGFPPHPELPNDCNWHLMVGRLRKFTLIENYALLDKVERYWTLVDDGTYMRTGFGPNIVGEYLVEVGLTVREHVEAGVATRLRARQVEADEREAWAAGVPYIPGSPDPTPYAVGDEGTGSETEL
jgi:hypothetical protein